MYHRLGFNKICFLLLTIPSSVIDMDHYKQLLNIFLGNISLPQFLLTILNSPQYQGHPSTCDATAAAPMILLALLKASPNVISDWAHSVVQMQYAQELHDLGSGENEWQFKALHASPEQIEGFQIDHIACEIEQKASRLWGLLDALLLNAREPKPSRMVVMEATGDVDEEGQESEYWNQVDDVKGIIEGITGTHVTRVGCLTFRRSAIIKLVYSLV